MTFSNLKVDIVMVVSQRRGGEGARDAQLKISAERFPDSVFTGKNMYWIQNTRIYSTVYYLPENDNATFWKVAITVHKLVKIELFFGVFCICTGCSDL